MRPTDNFTVLIIILNPKQCAHRIIYPASSSIEHRGLN
jgi:hypothetical protein